MNTNAFRSLHGPATIALATLLAACGTQPVDRSSNITTPQLSGTHWTVSRIDGRDVLPNTDLTADFGVDGRVSGDSGCNQYSGSFVQNGATVNFGELLSTRRDCLESGRAQQENRIMDIMSGEEATVQLVGNELHLRGDSGTVIFSNATLAQAAAGSRRTAQYDCQGVPLTIEYRGDRVRLTWPDGIDVLERTSSSDSDRVRYESRYSDLVIERDVMWGREGANPRACRELR